MKEHKSSMASVENTLYRSIVNQLSWVTGIPRPDTSFSVCESSTKISSPTIADIHYGNKII